MAEFFHMGGYGVFVWTAYGLSAAALVWLLVDTRRKLKDSNANVETARARRKGRA